MTHRCGQVLHRYCMIYLHHEGLFYCNLVLHTSLSVNCKCQKSFIIYSLNLLVVNKLVAMFIRFVLLGTCLGKIRASIVVPFKQITLQYGIARNKWEQFQFNISYRYNCLNVFEDESDFLFKCTIFVYLKNVLIKYHCFRFVFIFVHMITCNQY